MPRDARRRDARKPRLALVAHGIHDDGGMERAFAELIRRLSGRYDVVVFSSDLGNDLRPLVEWRRVPVPRRPMPLRFVLFYVLAALRLPFAKADIVHTQGAIVPNRSDVAGVHFFYAEFSRIVGSLAPREAPRVRRLNTAIANGLAIAAERWTYGRGRVACLAAVSHGLARELSTAYPKLATAVTPNGVEHERFRPDPEQRITVRRSLGIPDDDLMALFVGGDWDRKGLGIAIEAIAKASRAELHPWLVVVGRGNEERFSALARELGVAERIVFVGARRDTERFYAAADVFVLPSHYEAFPLVALEAAATGLPIVASRLNGVEELVGDDVAGRIVQREAGAVAEALCELAGSAETRLRLGAAARDRAASFTWDRSAETVESVYRSLGAEAVQRREGARA